MSTQWKKCSVCKSAIEHGATYYVCSVSGCQSKRKDFVFCKIQCWDEHRADLNHRNAWGEERTSPQPGEAARAPKRTVIGGTPSQPKAVGKIETETLVVVSKVKALIKDLSGMNTSQCAIDALTEKVIGECREAIGVARSRGGRRSWEEM